MMTSTFGSAIGIVSMTAGLWILGACSSDSAKPGVSAEAGSGGKGGTGNRSSLGGRTGSGGGASLGGRGAADAAGSCTKAVAVTCDGPEDCPTGQRCCGEWNQEYQQFGCFDSCIAQQGDAQPGPGGGALWFDLCHPGDACEDSTAQCLTSTYLPGSLSRCYTMGSPPNATLKNGKGEVNCGTDVCGTGEKCCIRGATLAPYCAPSGATCDCTVPTAAADGGKPPVKPGPDATTPPTDASTRD